MFWITQDPSSGSTDSYVIKTTRSGSTVLVVCAVGVWRHIQDLWRVCADSNLIKTTSNGSTVLVVCAVGVWRHIQDLWCVCAHNKHC
jgi:hypothetical protein